MTEKISLKQLCFIIFVTFSVSKFYIMPAVVAGASAESSPLAVLLNFIIDFLLLIIVITIIKRSKSKGFYELLCTLFGKVGATIIYFIYGLYFFSKALIPILEQKNSINLTFYESQPTLLTFMPFYLVAFYIILKGFTSFSRSVEITFWLFVLGLIITFSLSIPSGKYQRLLPLYTTGEKLLSGTHSALIWFGDPVILLFLYEFVENKKGLFKKTAISFTASAVTTVLLIVVFYAVFGTIAERQYFAPLKMSKYSITLSNIGRLDYMGALLFSLVSVFSLTLPLMISSLCFTKIFSFKKQFVIPLVICVAQGVLSYFFQNELFPLAEFFTSYVWVFYSVLCYLIPLVILIATLIKTRPIRQLKGA
ncbi:MAG: GerAB/ArcD/ProY family transporter [Clostridia bacterium]|nr:GerAB/ArcD/ProY family transporter [Clostridia bacterium]